MLSDYKLKSHRIKINLTLDGQQKRRLKSEPIIRNDLIKHSSLIHS
jgi:hypothetical protein